MLLEWLKADPKQIPTSSINLWHVTERRSESDLATEALRDALRDHLVGDDFLGAALAILPESTVKEMVEKILPTMPMLRKGAYGEILAVCLLEEIHGLTVPIKKMQFRTAQHDSPKATDVLAILLDPNGTVTEVALVEAKLRSTRRDISGLLDGAHDQLKKDCDCDYPDIILFTARMLNMKGDKLFDAVMQYLIRRKEDLSESHHIVLVIEQDCWQDTDIDSLSQRDDLLSNMNIHVVKVDHLVEKVNRSYADLGWEAMAGDD